MKVKLPHFLETWSKELYRYQIDGASSVASQIGITNKVLALEVERIASDLYYEWKSKQQVSIQEMLADQDRRFNR